MVVVGGGPAGCAAGVFTARYGLDPVVIADVDRVLERADDEQLRAALERRDDVQPSDDTQSTSV